MSEDIGHALAMPDVAERLNAAGAEDSGGSPERFAEFMRSEREKYSRLVKDAGIKVDS
jgi:tripartite-type tricarboxylate transporter receptor subunit TctC